MTSQVLTQQANSIDATPIQKALDFTLTTQASYAPIAARIGLAIVMFPHGAQKLLGWFGGHGWSGTYGFFTEQMGMPGIVAATVILLEFFGPLLLLAGLAIRPIALGFIGLMIGTIVMVHGQHGFFMNWMGNQSGEGIEYALLAIALSSTLLLSGGGSWSLDKKISHH